MRIGFVPLIDAAPLIAAYERGYFADEGLAVTLHRQIGWANVRDKLSFGHLDAAHALLGMPLASQTGRDSFFEPLVAVMGLGSGGNAVSVRRGLFEAGVRCGADLARFLKQHRGLGRPVIGHVFNCSMHHYLVREWLADAGLDPDGDTNLCVIPPPQMTEHMRGGYLDLFCVGEPWNTVAAREGAGVTLIFTTDILPGHPEKVLAVSQRFTSKVGGCGGPTITALVRAALRGCLWCAEKMSSGRAAELAAMLARPQYLAQPVDILQESLSIGRDAGASRIQRNARPANWTARSFAPEAPGSTFPNKMHSIWMMREMIRWGHLHSDADVIGIAQRCCDTAAYRAAATSVGIRCPDDDFVTMELRGGQLLRLEDVKSGRPLLRRPPFFNEMKAKARDRSPARVA